MNPSLTQGGEQDMATEGRLEGRIALITGGGKGIGQTIALAYAQEGVDVAVAGREKEPLNQTVTEVEALGQRGLAITTDVTQPEQVKDMAQKALDEFGKIDILLNCAGQRAVFPSVELAFEDWTRVMDVNLTASFLCSQAVAPFMIEQGYGKIIMMGSMQAHSGAPERATYCASKTALVGLTRCLGVEWAKHGINVNILSPGYFRTKPIERQIAIGELNLEAIERRTPANRIGEMKDLTGPAVFLASSESDFMCGQALIIDGGWMAYGFL
jgi:NAD(P)-dependent dehydrogenase (short-subunit alcohol dehydrogenase family)